MPRDRSREIVVFELTRDRVCAECGAGCIATAAWAGAGLVRASGPRRVPVVLTGAEVAAVRAKLGGDPWLVAMLLYGAGLRLMEALTLRVKDVDLARREIRVRWGKGAKDRVTVSPERLCGPLAAHLERVREQHGRDLATGERRRHHLDPTVVQRALGAAVRAAGPAKRATCHTLRHSFATQPAGGRLRHSHGAGTVGAFRREHHHGLYARPQPRRPRRQESGGSAAHCLGFWAAKHCSDPRMEIQ
jgi:integrase